LNEWHEGFEELEAIPHSFAIQFRDGQGAWSMFTDTENEKVGLVNMVINIKPALTSAILPPGKAFRTLVSRRWALKSYLEVSAGRFSVAFRKRDLLHRTIVTIYYGVERNAAVHVNKRMNGGVFLIGYCSLRLLSKVVKHRLVTISPCLFIEYMCC